MAFDFGLAVIFQGVINRATFGTVTPSQMQINTMFPQQPSIIRSESFSSWNDMKNAYKGTVTRFVRTNKPIGAPVPRNWFAKGGSIRIEKLWNGRTRRQTGIPCRI